MKIVKLIHIKTRISVGKTKWKCILIYNIKFWIVRLKNSRTICIISSVCIKLNNIILSFTHCGCYKYEQSQWYDDEYQYHYCQYEYDNHNVNVISDAISR